MLTFPVRDPGPVFEELPVDQPSMSSPVAGHHIPASTSPARNASEIFLGAVAAGIGRPFFTVLSVIVPFRRHTLTMTTIKTVMVRRRVRDAVRTIARTMYLVGGFFEGSSTAENT